MQTLVLALTENSYWSHEVLNHTVLFWALDSLKRILHQSWVHVVYHDEAKSGHVICDTLKQTPWLHLGGVYPVPHTLSTTHAAMVAFPSFFNNEDGFYLFDGRTVLHPDLKGLPRHDWFPYCPQEGPASFTLQDSNNGDKTSHVTPVGLYGFANYQKFFRAARQTMADPVEVYDSLGVQQPVAIAPLRLEQFHWVNTDASVEHFDVEMKRVYELGP